jgi:hypothetical protein
VAGQAELVHRILEKEVSVRSYESIVAGVCSMLEMAVGTRERAGDVPLTPKTDGGQYQASGQYDNSKSHIIPFTASAE